MILPRSFYEEETVTVAKMLVGCYLVHLEGDMTTSGRIVETEAYLQQDPAAHSFHGRTPGNSVLFGPAGHAHLFFVYGRHWCMNVVTGRGAGGGEAVLIRALEPVEGIPVMQERRGLKDLRLLCSGPGRLTQALAITGEYNGLPLDAGPLQIWSPDSLSGSGVIFGQEIVQTTRVGISRAREFPYRFFLKANPYVSRGTSRKAGK
jgi:DNA-3-methyladenine glycosylase